MKVTAIEVKCECAIPFHHELVACLYKVLSGKIAENQLPAAVPHREAICNAIQRKMLFIKITFECPVSKWRHRLSTALRRIFGKDVVGTIERNDGITIILV